MTLPPDIPAPGGTWTCPAHPDVREQSPGACRLCGAPLVRVGSTPAPEGGRPPRPPAG